MGFHLQVAGCNRIVDSVSDSRACEMSKPRDRSRGSTDVTSVRANRVAGVVHARGYTRADDLREIGDKIDLID